MTQTTKDEAERIGAYVAAAKRITMQARAHDNSDGDAWFEWSQEQIEADIYAALLAARAAALEEGRENERIASEEIDNQLVIALAWLVGLKDNRPSDYAEQKPMAWEAARAALRMFEQHRRRALAKKEQGE